MYRGGSQAALLFVHARNFHEARQGFMRFVPQFALTCKVPGTCSGVLANWTDPEVLLKLAFDRAVLLKETENTKNKVIKNIGHFRST